MSLAAVAFAAALSSDVQGKAVIDCAVTAQGHLRRCVVVSETPLGRNVGAFALKLASGYHIQPGDRRISRGRIRIPMQFKLP